MKVLASGITTITIMLLLHGILVQYHTKYVPSTTYIYIACVAVTENFFVGIGKLIAKRQLVPQTGCFIKF